MHLEHHWASRGCFCFDAATGVALHVASVDPEKRNWGYVWDEGDNWYAIYRGSDSLLFQTGPRTWRLDNTVEFVVSRGLRRIFQISKGTNVELSVTYLFRGAPHLIDPTYDAIDEDKDDFFLYVAGMWRRWKDRTLKEFMLQDRKDA